MKKIVKIVITFAFVWQTAAATPPPTDSVRILASLEIRNMPFMTGFDPIVAGSLEVRNDTLWYFPLNAQNINLYKDRFPRLADKLSKDRNPAYVQPFCIAFADIKNIRRRNVFGIIPNRMAVSGKHSPHKYYFASYQRRKIIQAFHAYQKQLH